VRVAAAQPVEVQAEGAGFDTLSSSTVHLGQELEPFLVLLKDEAGALPGLCPSLRSVVTIPGKHAQFFMLKT
jgi:hypothetical protein